METMTRNQVHAQTARMDIHEIVRNLNAALGPTLVAALSGSKDKKQPIRWAKPKPEGVTPSQAFQVRLRLAYEEWRRLSSAEGDHVARAWFVGGNPNLGEDTPITAIREGRHKEVVDAVTAFIESIG